MPEPRATDRNRERIDDDPRGFEAARRDLAEAHAETRADAEAFGEREQAEREEREGPGGGDARGPGR